MVRREGELPLEMTSLMRVRGDTTESCELGMKVIRVDVSDETIDPFLLPIHVVLRLPPRRTTARVALNGA